MAKINTKLAYFSFFMFIVGIVCTVLVWDIQSKLSNKCIDTKVQNGLNFLLALSVMMVVVPIVQIVCYWGCGCKQDDLPYTGLTLVILLTLAVTSWVVYSGLKGDCDLDYGKNVVGIIGGISTGILVLYGGYKGYQAYGGKYGGKKKSGAAAIPSVPSSDPSSDLSSNPSSDPSSDFLPELGKHQEFERKSQSDILDDPSPL